MTIQPPDIDPAALSAIDVHVHLEAVETSDTDAAARDYFGDSGAPRDPGGLAEYYRSRRMAFVVFTVDRLWCPQFFEADTRQLLAHRGEEVFRINLGNHDLDHNS